MNQIWAGAVVKLGRLFLPAFKKRQTPIYFTLEKWGKKLETQFPSFPPVAKFPPEGPQKLRCFPNKMRFFSSNIRLMGWPVRSSFEGLGINNSNNFELCDWCPAMCR